MPATAHALIGPAIRMRSLFDADPDGGPLRLVTSDEAPSPFVHVPQSADAAIPTTPHVGAFARIDAQQRISLAGAVRDLRWDEGRELVVELTAPGQAEVRSFDPADQRPGMEITRVDRGRIRLAPGVRASLELVPGDQVLAIALPDQGRVLLSNAATALARMTGLLAPASSPVQAAVPAAGAGARGTGPRAAWRPRPA